MKLIRAVMGVLVVFALTGFGLVSQAQYQTANRMSDRRVLQLVKRLETHSDRFSRSIDAALDRSRLDGTVREDNINALVDEFEYDTDLLRKRVEDGDAVVSDMEAVLMRAQRIDAVVRRNLLYSQAQRDWSRVRADLDQLSRVFNVGWGWQAIATTNATRTLPARQVIRRLESRVDEFQNTLDGALDRSSLNGTELENQINAMAQKLEKDADILRDRMDNRTGGGIVAADVESVLNRAMEIENFMLSHRNQLDPRVERDWARVKANLNELAYAYKVTWVWTIRAVPETVGTNR